MSSQNLFQQGSYLRAIRLNSLYMVIFDNVHDRQQIMRFFMSMKPGKWRALMQIYDDAVSVPHSYLFIDLRIPELRFRTKIEPDFQIIYTLP